MNASLFVWPAPTLAAMPLAGAALLLWPRSFVPMATMALGGLLAAIAYKTGPASIVSPLSGAYPVVTLGFAWAVLKERATALQWIGIAAILTGFVFTTMGVG